MNSQALNCPACSNARFEKLIDFGKVPRSGTFLSRPGEPFTTIDLAFDYCLVCALLRQRARADDSHDYTHVSRSTARQLPAYATYLAGSFQREGIGPSELIVEVGANDGAFMDLLVKEGFTNLVGIEPSQACATTSIEKGHKIEITHLTEPVAAALCERYGSARAVICRHTLEHVPDPLELLGAMKSLLAADGLLFIEVPNAQAIIHDLRGHELWDEHLHIMTPGNLQMLVQRAAFSVTNNVVWPHCGTTNILLWARLRSPAVASGLQEPCSSDVTLCRKFEQRWNSLRAHAAAELAESPRPVVAIGASHPQSNYLIFSGLGEHVASLVDDDPTKAGHYLPLPQPVPIISSAQFLKAQPPATVIRTAFGYEDWMNRLLAPFATTGVRLLQPYAVPLLTSLPSPEQGSPLAQPDKQVDITAAITCYNEEEFIVDSLDNVSAALRKAGCSFEIIVIDDVSKDNSVQKIREYMKAHPELPITLKVNETNRGLANNCVEAAFLGKGKYYRLCCGDNPEPNEALVGAFIHIGKADIVVPYQIQQAVVGKSKARRILSQVFTFLVNLISGYNLKYYNGMPIYRRYDVMRWHPSSYGFGFQADILTRLLDEGATYLQIPSIGIDRKGSKSTAINLRNVLSVGHTLLELAIRRLRRLLYGRTMRKPVEVFLDR